ncbi:hypothetical protein IY145_24035 [Methylosinus sp. H3A]|uniref:hypothetical protein n=1 Tax=Methylosinus sp. H3A TaxID=2785786 RepID=UPI0018C1F652|nr:hypothetical protein [Methylosinus sp. H3A]MBG0812410.1 hypothetical protein [Methylosinus sp. H3A]
MPPHAKGILAQREEKPDVTIMELSETLRGASALARGVWRFVPRMGSRAKRRQAILGADKENVASARDECFGDSSISTQENALSSSRGI